jgi:antitoxin HicB
VNALETMLAARITDQQDLPLPSPAGGRPCAVLSGLVTAKALLYRAMREAGVGSAELTRRPSWQTPQVERLLDLNHASRLDQIETALAALGKRLDVRMSDAA